MGRKPRFTGAAATLLISLIADFHTAQKTGTVGQFYDDLFARFFREHPLLPLPEELDAHNGDAAAAMESAAFEARRNNIKKVSSRRRIQRMRLTGSGSQGLVRQPRKRQGH